MVKVVANTTSPALLGRTFLRAYNFESIQVNNISETNQHAILIEQIKSELGDVFKSKLGFLMESYTKPIYFKPRQSPLAWKDKVEKKLRSMIDVGVLEHVDSSDWGTPLSQF